MSCPAGESPRFQYLHRFLLAGTLAMTYLTIAKELVLYQNSPHFVPFLIYKLAMRAYYPLLVMNFCGLLVAGFYSLRRQGNEARFLCFAWIVFTLNVALFSANNVLNILEGNPVHRRHRGIGW